MQVTAHVDPGPLTPDERTQLVAEWQKGAIALPTLQARLGIEDVAAEQKALDADPLVKLTTLKRQLEVFEVAARVTSVEGAARALVAAGMDRAVVDALLPQDTDGAEVTP